MNLATTEATTPTEQNLEQLESRMLKLPQVEIPLSHYFGPGIYIREVIMPTGSIVMGHTQKFEHLNILVKGSAMFIKDGKLITIKAPHIFTCPPGRKIIYVLEEAVWQNVYATCETDLDKLENMLIDKSPTWESHHRDVTELQAALKHTDMGG